MLRDATNKGQRLTRQQQLRIKRDHRLSDSMSAQLSSQDITRWSQHVERDDEWNDDFDLPTNTRGIFSDIDSTTDAESRKWSDFDIATTAGNSSFTADEPVDDDFQNKTLRGVPPALSSPRSNLKQSPKVIARASPKSVASPKSLQADQDSSFDEDFDLPQKMDSLKLAPRVDRRHSKLSSEIGSEDWDAPKKPHRASISSASTFSPSSSTSSAPSAIDSEDGFDDLEFPEKINQSTLKSRLEVRQHRAREVQEDFFGGLEIKDDFAFSPHKLRTIKQQKSTQKPRRMDSIMINVQRDPSSAFSTPNSFGRSGGAQMSSRGGLLSPDEVVRSVSRKQSVAALKAQPSSTDRALRKKASMPALRSSHMPSGNIPPVPRIMPRSPSDPRSKTLFIAAGPTGQTSHHVSTKRSPSTIKPQHASELLAPPLAVPKRSTSAGAPLTTTTSSHGPTGTIRGRPPTLPVVTTLRRPKGQRARYGDGTELDAFDDLPTSFEKEKKYRVIPVEVSAGKLKRTFSQTLPSEKEKPKPQSTSPAVQALSSSTRKTPTSSRRRKNRNSKAPTLIRNLNASTQERRVGDMVYNPSSHRWEGNESVLTEFEQIQTSPSRPALITNAAIGSLKRNSKPPIVPADLSRISTSTHSSGGSNNVKVVGDMLFDPVKMCWVHTGGADYEEDVFANIDDDNWTSNGADDSFTRTTTSLHDDDTDEGMMTIRGRKGDFEVGDEFDLSPEFIREAMAAEQDHYKALKGWISPNSSSVVDRQYLFEIRDIATGL